MKEDTRRVNVWEFQNVLRIAVLSFAKSLRHEWTDTPELHQVVKLAVDVPGNSDRALDRLYIRFFLQELLTLFTQGFHLIQQIT